MGFMSSFRENLGGWIRKIFKKKRARIGLYGPPNAGKTTLANRILKDWSTGDAIGTVSPIPHETRRAMRREGLVINANGSSIELEGVIEAIKWLDDLDGVLLVMDSTEDPYTQVNVTVIGNMEARKLPLLIVANKMDLPNASPSRISAAFPQHSIVPISALEGSNIDDLYQAIATHFG